MAELAKLLSDPDGQLPEAPTGKTSDERQTIRQLKGQLKDVNAYVAKLTDLLRERYPAGAASFPAHEAGSSGGSPLSSLPVSAGGSGNPDDGFPPGLLANPPSSGLQGMPQVMDGSNGGYPGMPGMLTNPVGGGGYSPLLERMAQFPGGVGSSPPAMPFGASGSPWGGGYSGAGHPSPMAQQLMPTFMGNPPLGPYSAMGATGQSHAPFLGGYSPQNAPGGQDWTQGPVGPNGYQPMNPGSPFGTDFRQHPGSLGFVPGEQGPAGVPAGYAAGNDGFGDRAPQSVPYGANVYSSLASPPFGSQPLYQPNSGVNQELIRMMENDPRHLPVGQSSPMMTHSPDVSHFLAQMDRYYLWCEKLLHQSSELMKAYSSGASMNTWGAPSAVNSAMWGGAYQASANLPSQQYR